MIGQKQHIRYNFGGQSIHLVVGRPGFDFLAKSDQNTFKVGIHNSPAWRLAFKRVSLEIGSELASLLVVSLGNRAIIKL